MSEEAGSGARKILFFWPATPSMAIEDDDAPAPRMTSTPSLSYQRPARVAATSALFWMSPLTSSIFLPAMVPPKSSIAICAAITAPGPLMSAYRLDMSVATPTLTTSLVYCADAGRVHAAKSTAADQNTLRFIVSLPRPYSWREPYQETVHEGTYPRYPNQGRGDRNLRLLSGTGRALSPGAVPHGCARHPRRALRHGPAAGDLRLLRAAAQSLLPGRQGHQVRAGRAEARQRRPQPHAGGAHQDDHTAGDGRHHRPDRLGRRSTRSEERAGRRAWLLHERALCFGGGGALSRPDRCRGVVLRHVAGERCGGKPPSHAPQGKRGALHSLCP